MGFIDSYKRLEKLCGDVMGCDRPVTAYIDEMKATPRGAYYVAGWGSDLEMLKRYRWIRNQIAHEPGCTEANMCGAGDAAWIDQFYGRIMDQTDPLALYEKEMKRQRAEQSKLFTDNRKDHIIVRLRQKSKLLDTLSQAILWSENICVRGKCRSLYGIAI